MKTTKNRTWHYLLPLTRSFHPNFYNRFLKLFKIKTGIWDYGFSKNGFENEDPRIFILFDRTINKKEFNKFVVYCQAYVYNYETIYTYSNTIENNRYRMMVFKIPPEYIDTYNYFVNGQYSLMYDYEEIEKYFPRGESQIKDVLLNKKKKQFRKTIIKDFNLNQRDIKINDVLQSDYNIYIPEETFNYTFNEETL